GAGDGVVLALRDDDLRERAREGLARLGIVTDDAGAAADEEPRERERRRVADVVGLGLERETPERDRFSVRLAERALDERAHEVDLLLVRAVRGLGEAHRHLVF